MLIHMEIEFKIDEKLFFDEEEGKNWFDECLADLSLFSNVIGDVLAEKITVKKVEGGSHD